jgi:hypothetical protein
MSEGMQCDRKMFFETGTGSNIVTSRKLLNRTINGATWQKAGGNEIPVWQSARGFWSQIRNFGVINKVTENGIDKIKAKL